MAQKYKALLNQLLSYRALTIDESIAEHAATIRADYGYRPADSLQLAAAVIHDCDIFYTNDRKLSGFDTLDVVTVG